jgi:NADH-quinone oxidoreductase subunit A
LTAILFVLFDVEVIFFYPYAVNFKALELEGLLAVILFVAFFLIGFLYVLKKGALEWEK